MTTPPWFHMQALADPGQTAWLMRDETRHALGAKRLFPGDAITLFDGRGSVAQARIGAARASDGTLPVEILSRESAPQPTPEITIATAVPKGDHWTTLLDMAAQLGVSTIIPIDCERSVVAGSAINRSRAERILLEACKQARRAWIPQLTPASTPLIAAQHAKMRGSTILVAHPEGVAAGETLRRMAPSTSASAQHPTRNAAPSAIVLIGPEGGFTESEVASVVALGAQSLSFGASILRVETAVVAALALCRIA